MSTPDPNESRFNSGQLAYGCTNLATAWPHGGTALGTVGDIFFKPQTRYIQGSEEEGQGGRAFKAGGPVILGLELLQHNDDAVGILYQSVVTQSGKKVVKLSRAAWGDPVTALTNLVFTPNDPTHWGIVLFNALPLIDLNAQLALSAHTFLSLPVVFQGQARSADEEIGQWGPISSLTLV